MRFGGGASGLWAASTTGTSTARSTRCTTATHWAAWVPLAHMMLGEVQPGRHRRRIERPTECCASWRFSSPASPVGRTPNQQKIQATEMKLVTLYILAMPIALLSFCRRVPADTPPRWRRGTTLGRMVFPEILCAYTSGADSNRSALCRSDRVYLVAMSTRSEWRSDVRFF